MKLLKLTFNVIVKGVLASRDYMAQDLPQAPNSFYQL